MNPDDFNSLYILLYDNLKAFQTGKALEQAVFLELKRRGAEIFFFKEKAECDFIIKRGLEITDAIQVCASLADEKTRKRELRGLLECCAAFGLQQGLIIAEKWEADGVQITAIPLYRWLLQ